MTTVARPHAPMPYRWFGPIIDVRLTFPAVTQGEITPMVIKGKAVGRHRNAGEIRRYRKTMKTVLAAYMAGSPWTFPLDGPVAVCATFTMPKPKSAPVGRRTFPAVRPDYDHLARALNDALKEAGVYGDDGQIIDGWNRKVYPLEHPQALAVPGTWLQVYRVTAGEPAPVQLALIDPPSGGEPSLAPNVSDEDAAARRAVNPNY